MPELVMLQPHLQVEPGQAAEHKGTAALQSWRLRGSFMAGGQPRATLGVEGRYH